MVPGSVEAFGQFLLAQFFSGPQPTPKDVLFDPTRYLLGRRIHSETKCDTGEPREEVRTSSSRISFVDNPAAFRNLVPYFGRKLASGQ